MSSNAKWNKDQDDETNEYVIRLIEQLDSLTVISSSLVRNVKILSKEINAQKIEIENLKNIV